MYRNNAGGGPRHGHIGNMHKNLVKNHAYGTGDILADRQTDTHTETCSLQYFATVPATEVSLINEDDDES